MKNYLKKNYLQLITLLFLYSGIFIAFLYPPSDPDLGWHLKYGEYFFQNHSILKANIFSQLMPDFIWHNSSWGTDLITYLAFYIKGFLGITILGAATGLLTMLFMGWAAKLSIFEKSIIFPIVVFLVSPVFQISFRGQTLSLLLLSILYYVLSLYEKNNKTSLILIPLFLLWGNLHGQYILGLGIFTIWFLIFSTKEIILKYKKDVKGFIKNNKYLVTTFILSPFALLINPYGIGVYQEALGHFDDPFQKSITEFLSPTDFSTTWWNLLFAGIALVLGIALLGNGRKNFDKSPFYFPSLILYLLTFWVKRYAWSFYISLVFLLQPIVKFFEPESKKYSLLSSLFISVTYLCLIFIIKYPFTNIQQMNWNTYCRITTNCSAGASEFVINNKLNNEKLLTIYDYGGFLIWKYPEIKPTIDGRMHLWRDENNFSAFEYYYPIEQNTSKDIQDTKYESVLTSRFKPIYFRLIELTNQKKWSLIYQDDYSAVFFRNFSEKN